MSITPSAIVPPRLHHRIARPRLKRKLRDIAAARVVLVRAPAGYGKTNAIADWADALRAAGRPVLWVAPRSGIAETQQLMAAIHAAAAAEGIDLDGACEDRIAERLLVASGTSGNTPVLVVDDIHLLTRESSALLERITGQARNGLTMILGARNKPYLPLARLRAMERLIEVVADDLAMDATEIANLAALRTGKRIDLEEARELREATRGWPAGVSIALQRRMQEPDGSTALFGYHREMRQYFAEEVTACAPAGIERFLTDTAILERLTPQACAAIADVPDSLTMLETAARHGMFLDCVDERDSVWSLHPLFRQTLLHVLTNREARHYALLHTRAARYFAQQGAFSAAVRHAAEAGDPDALGALLEVAAEPMTYAGDLPLVVRQAESLPWSILSTLPMTLLSLAWYKVRRLSFSSAETLIDAAERCLDDARTDAADPAIVNLRRLIRHRRFLLAAARDDMPYVEREAEALLAELGDDKPYLSCTILAQLMSARRELYHFHDALRLQAETQRALSRPGSDFASIAFKSAVAPGLVGQGKADAAAVLLHEALSTARQIIGPGSGVAALPALPLAELLYDRDDLHGAAALVSEHIGVVREFGFVDHLLSGYLVETRLMVAEGRVEEALVRLEQGQLVAIEGGLERLRVAMIAEQIRLLLQQGRVAEAQSTFDNASFAEKILSPSILSCRRDELVAIAWLRLEMRAGRLASARKVARHWREFVRRNGAIQSAVKFDLLLAQIAVLAGDVSEARRSIREAVSLAAPSGWVRMFLDEGEAVTTLLVDAYRESPSLETLTDRFAQDLVACLAPATIVVDEEGEGGLSGRLVLRETQILGMVAGGLRNREVGDRLGLTEGTVKWYMQQIFDKLGVRRRPQAVARARQLGLL